MSKFRIACLMLSLCWAAPAAAGVTVGIGLPSVQIGINLPVYPQLVRVPGYPVYYAPDLSSNYFFYDGLYWVYQGDSWYASSWYNGPWGSVDPGYVPAYVLRVPVRYYRQPPRYFRGWASNEPPRWDQHWGQDWSRRRTGWDHWSHKPRRPAPLPIYQREYSGDRYPSVESQPTLHGDQYRYRPKTRVVRETYRAQRIQPARESDSRDTAPHDSKAAPPEAARETRGASSEPRRDGQSPSSKAVHDASNGPRRKHGGDGRDPGNGPGPGKGRGPGN